MGPTLSPTPTEPSSLLTSSPLLLPVPATSLPEVALLADSMQELLLDLTAKDTATDWWLTPTVPLSPLTSPLSRLPVPTTLLPRKPSTLLLDPLLLDPSLLVESMPTLPQLPTAMEAPST